MGRWIGPRRAMLLLAIACIGVGWYLKDYVIPSLGFDVNVGACFSIAGIVLIASTILYSLVNSC